MFQCVRALLAVKVEIGCQSDMHCAGKQKKAENIFHGCTASAGRRRERNKEEWEYRCSGNQKEEQEFVGQNRASWVRPIKSRNGSSAIRSNLFGVPGAMGRC